MTRRVLKFGGTSVADIDRIRHAARRIAFERRRGIEVIVSVSAMAGVTNQLVDYARQLGGTPKNPEYDTVVASGEQVTAGLLALALSEFGLNGRSYGAWQLPIWTDNNYGRSKIIRIETDLIEETLKQGDIPIVAGFQGLSPDKRLTTLGRGGSDITAVALAAALNAAGCDLYKDVNGIYTADPRIVPFARRLMSVTYDEMIQLAALGSKVLQSRAVEMAKAHGIPLFIFSSFEESTGTHITHKDPQMEQRHITGIALSSPMIQVSFQCDAKKSHALLIHIGQLGDRDITIDMLTISNLGGGDQKTHLSFVIDELDVTALLHYFNTESKTTSLPPPRLETDLARVSIVGSRLRTDGKFQGDIFTCLNDNAIPFYAITCTEMTFSILVPARLGKKAVGALHRILIDESQEDKNLSA